jgi:uncharacterized membrane protein YedE/YeeE
MRDKAITGGVLLGLTCTLAGLYATIYRSGASSCSVPDGCDVPTPNPHTYAAFGVVLVLVGLVAFGVAIRLASNRAASTPAS